MVGVFWKAQLFLKIKEYVPLSKPHSVLILSTVSLNKSCSFHLFFPCLNNYSFKTQGGNSEGMGME